MQPVQGKLTRAATDTAAARQPAGESDPRAEAVPAAALDTVSIAFGATRALSEVSFDLHAGEVLALVGENGAGKSTCVKVLGGVYRPDGGAVRVAGERVVLHGPLDALRRGIAVVNQHPGLFADLSIAENIYAGRPLRTAAGLLDHAAMRRQARSVMARLGLDQDPGTLVATLRTSEQQLVEIARALVADARVLILDEPTAALSTTEVDRLFGLVAELRRQGVAMLFVGHRLEEIFRIADRITVLRDGNRIATRPVADLSEDEVVQLMVGRALTHLYPDRQGSTGEPVLTVEGLAAPTGLHDISFQVRAGEIVGLAGLVGSGRTELARVLFGIDRKDAGEVELCGRPAEVRSASAALAHGIAYVSEDRRGQSVIEDFSVLDNATLPVIRQATKFGLLRKRLEIALVAGSLNRMSLRFRSYDQPVSTLSGGNQQKVVLAKWLATQPQLLILDEPTQGIDVAAKAEVHRIIADLADQGLAVLLISSDLPEVLGMSDRILVMRRGGVVAEFSREQATEELVTAAATGASEKAERAALTLAPEPPAATRDRATARPSRVMSAIRALTARRELGLVAALACMIVPISVLNPNFLTSTNLSSVSGEAALVGLVAAGEMLVVLTRNIDVSVGSIIGLTAFIFGSWVKDHPGQAIAIPVLIAAAVGLACGLINGLVVGYGGVPSIVVTLGTLYVYRGVDSILANGKEVAPGDIPNSYQNFLAHDVLGLSALVWICLAVLAVLGALLFWTARGRQFYQAGSNPDGARLIGVPINRRVLAAFTVSGALAGLAGVLWAGHYGIVDGQSATGLELTVIAAVVVGGVALRGGSGTVFGIALGTVALFTIQNVLELAKVNSADLQAFYGAAIILAATIDGLIARRTRRPRVVV